MLIGFMASGRFSAPGIVAVTAYEYFTLFLEETMSQVCEICGKHPVSGHSISHSHRVTLRKFRPNIQKVTIVQNGRKKKMNVCTRCLKKGNLNRSFKG